MTDRLTNMLAKLGASDKTFWFSIPLLNRLVVHHDIVRAALAHPGVAVPYGPGSGVLDVDFVLAETDPEKHAAKRALVHRALQESASAKDRGLQRAGTIATTAVMAALAGTGRIDVVTDVVHPAVEAWAMEWLGLPPEFGPRAHLVSQHVMHRIFFNPAFPGGKVDETASNAAVAATNAFRMDLRKHIASVSTHSGVLAHLLGSGLSQQEVEANMIGLTVGPMALACQTMVTSLEALLRLPAEERTKIIDNHASNDRGLRALFLELARLNPPAPVFIRRAAKKVEIRNEMKPLRTRGTMVIAAGAAMLDPRVFANPKELQPDRFLHASGPHLAFGGGMHACMGTDAYADLVPHVLRELVRCPGLRADGPVVMAPAPFPTASKKARGNWSFPGSYRLYLT
jgi:cytochrome P450